MTSTGRSGWIDAAEAVAPPRRSPSESLGTTRCGRVCKKLRIRVHGPNPRDRVHDGEARHCWLSSFLPRPHKGVSVEIPISVGRKNRSLEVNLEAPFVPLTGLILK